MTDTVAPKPHGVRGKPFQKGQSGNPLGRPIGARNKLESDFTAALQRDFAAHGEAAVAKTRESEPATYLKIIASLASKHHEVRRTLEALSDRELADIIARANLATDAAISEAATRGANRIVN
jgi:uncharacterized protein YjiS (DUF1127 family)